MGRQSWWIGALIGAAHGIVLLTALAPLSLLHPRIASDHDRPRFDRAIEPLGFFGLHYGRQTPAVTILAHAIFGAALPAL